MKDILDTIVARRSVRAYKPEMVKQELIEKVTKAGSYAPSGKNMQSQIILAITNQEVRNKLANLCASLRGMPKGADPFYGAPVALVVLADKNVPTYVYDGSVVMQNMLLEAYSLGLGACWIHHCKQMFETSEGKELLKSLGITGDYEGIGTCILGYPNENMERDIPRKDNYIYYIK